MSICQCSLLVLFCTLHSVRAQVISSPGATITTPSGATVYSFLTGVTSGTSGSITFSATTVVDVLIVGGGAAGGANVGGGGSGGGMIYATGVSIPAGSYDVIVGSGGLGGLGSQGGAGRSSSVFGSFAYPGGGGGVFPGGGGGNGPANGGGGSASGGLGGYASSATYVTGILSGASTLVTKGGNSGGNGANNPTYRGGGGGGAGGSGVSGVFSGSGADGFQCSITGTSLYWAAGGGGSGYDVNGANGGLGGGGGGSWFQPPAITGGVGGTGGMNTGGTGGYRSSGGYGGANTGSGGGGGTSSASGGNGAHGIVVIRVASTPSISKYSTCDDVAYLADLHRIRNLNLITGQVASVAGQTTSGNIFNIVGSSAAFNRIAWLQKALVSTQPYLFVADSGNCAMKFVSLSNWYTSSGAGTGACTRVDGTPPTGQFGGFGNARALSFDGSNIIFWDASRYMRTFVISTGAVSTIGGTGTFATNLVDGPLSSTSLGDVYGMSMHPNGQYILFGDNGGTYRVIRNLTLSTMQVTTVAGNTVLADVDGIGTSASFSNITSLAIHPSGTLAVIATSRSNIKLLNFSTMRVTHLAGNGFTGTSTDGVGPSAAFNYIASVTFDSKGTYVIVSDVYKARKLVLRSGNVTTIAGQSTSGTTDGIGTAVGFQATPLAVVVAGSTCTDVTDCSAGYYSKVAGQPSASNCVQCTVCAANQYTSQYCTTVADAVCVNCSAGTVPYGDGPSGSCGIPQPTSTGATITKVDGATVYSFLNGVTTGTSGSITFSATTQVDVLIVGGGGSGGLNTGGGGGGGAVVYATGISISAGTYPVVVGAGAGVDYTRAHGYSSSVFSSTAPGGGHGGNFDGNNPFLPGSGANGGGTGGGSTAPAVGLGNEAPTLSALLSAAVTKWGYSGGAHPASLLYRGGGGGGAGGNGVAADGGGHGGIGFQCSITGTSLYWAGGGGAGSYNINAGNGGLGGGGGGTYTRTGTIAADGTGGGGGLNAGSGGVEGFGGNAGANTGGGGGGGPNLGKIGYGGSGIVVIRVSTATVTSTASCPSGQYPSASSCLPCTNAGIGGNYTGNGTTSINCPVSCNAGYYQNAGFCMACPKDWSSTSNSFSCTPLTFISYSTCDDMAYLADSHRIRTLNVLTGQVTTVAGQTTSGLIGGTGTSAAFNFIAWLQPIAHGQQTMFIAESSNYMMRVTDIGTWTIFGFSGSGTSGVVDGTGLAQYAGFSYGTRAMSIDGAYIIFWDLGKYMRKIVISTRAVTTLGGNGGFSNSPSDGAIGSCLFGNVFGMSMHPSGQYILFGDNFGPYGVIRNLTLSTMQVTTVVGYSSAINADVDGVGTSASFAGIRAIAIHPSGNLAVFATFNANIKLLNLSTMQVTHLAGTGVTGTSTDGVGKSAAFTFIGDLTFDSQGTYILVADYQKVRNVVLRNANVTTIAGQSASCTADGIGTDACFQSYPYAAVVAGSTCTNVSDCALGYYSKVVGQPSSTNCVPCTVCRPTQYTQYCTTTTDAACITCPSGQYLDTSGCMACSNARVGEYYTDSGTTSTNCPVSCIAGFYLNSSGLCSACPTGWFSKRNSSICIPGNLVGGAGGSGVVILRMSASVEGVVVVNPTPTCTISPPGSYSILNSSSYMACAVGTYTPGTGYSACLACGANTFSNISGASVCSGCPQGTTSVQGTTGCVCANGYYGVYVPNGISSCTPCTTSNYCLMNASTPTPCPAGTFAATTGLSVCTTCTQGGYCLGNGSAPSLCPNGTSSAATGATALTTCANCSAGNYMTGIGAVYCVACVAGRFQATGGATFCDICATGTYTAKPGGTTCTLCQSGQYQTGSASSSCTVCSQGTYSTGSGAVTNASCFSCGYATFGVLNAKTCIDCQSNSNSSMLSYQPFQCLCYPGYARTSTSFLIDSRGGDIAAGPSGAVYSPGPSFGNIVVSTGGNTVNGFGIPRGLQILTISVTGVYTLVAAGAQGSGGLGGYGVVVSTTVALKAGNILTIMVGQSPAGSSDPPGGGGTFITQYSGTGAFSSESSHVVLLVAGGGAGPSRFAGSNDPYTWGQLTTAGGVACGDPNSAAVNGGGGGAICQYGGDPLQGRSPGYCDYSGSCGGGGSGYIQSGLYQRYSWSISSYSFLGGGAGVCTACSANPGFGGGGQAWKWGGGGGGYSGGQGGSGTGGGGGGSYDINGIGNTATRYDTWSTSMGSAPGTFSGGYNVGDGFVKIALTDCSPCAPGTYATGVGHTVCSQCATGTYQTGTASTVCTLCSAGTFMSALGASVCTQCSANSYCPSVGASSTVVCPNNTFSYSGASSVYQCICPDNSQWKQGTNCTCNDGFFPVVNSSAFGGFQCAFCQPGSYCVNGQSYPCAAGTYQTGVDTTACDKCAMGTYMPRTSSTDCMNCPQNSYTTSVGANSSTQCLCKAGWFGKMNVTSTFLLDSRSGSYYAGPDGSVPYASGPSFGTITISSGATTVNGFTIPRGVQVLRVTDEGLLTIVAAGANGQGTNGGKGIVVNTSVPVSKGAILTIMVGQTPTAGSDYRGGGGTFVTLFSGNGSFAAASSHTLLLAAGGGGGMCRTTTSGLYGLTSTSGGVITTCSSTYAAVNGGGGGAMSDTAGQATCLAGGNPLLSIPPTDQPRAGGFGGGGGGFIQNGGGTLNGLTSGISFLNGGGFGMCREGTTCVGYGGGGQAWYNGGGGGGYSGGQGGSTTYCGGAGGGSYDYSGVNKVATQYTNWSSSMGTSPSSYSSGWNTADGFVKILYETLPCTTACPANTYCPGIPVVGSFTCPNNTFSYPGAGDVSQCICPKNAEWVSGTNCTCASGFYTISNASSFGGFQCEYCRAGSYCVKGQQAPCGAGTYQTGIGGSECTLCAAGTFINGTGSTECTICPAGSACKNASVAPVPCSAGQYQSASGTTSCDACGAGAYQTGTGNIQCQVCPAGSACLIPNLSPVPCPIGKYQSGSGATGCVACGAGSYANGTGTIQCTVCPSGSACLNASMLPIPCPPGQYQSATGNTSCVACGAGLYQTGTGTTQCIGCPSGSACSVANVLPVPCPIGQYQSGEGFTSCDACGAGSYANSTGTTQCEICPSGSACLNSSLPPVICSVGQFQSASGTTSCVDCGAGSYQTTTGTTVCSLCSAGLFSTGSGMTSVTTCGECTTGTYQTGLGATICSLCQKGTYNPDTASNASSACVVCPPGYYCQENSLSSPTPCAAGTYLETTGATSKSNCLMCQPGTYSLSTALTYPCPVCQADHFCLTTTEKSQCPAHTISGNGSFSLLQCHCVKGRICIYAKRIHVVVTLNISLSDFQADVGSAQTNFLQALHDAAGIQEEHHPIEIAINNIAPAAPTGRRLLEDTSGYIDVYATVSGVVHLKHLKHHLARHIPEIHVAHTMQHEHRVHVVPNN